jgi:hypothetical protein
LIDRTSETPSSLQFKHPNTRDASIDSSGIVIQSPYYWDIYSDANGLKFNTIGGGSSQRMVISRNGYVGIGITTPKAKLHVDQNILTEGNITTLNKFVFAPAVNATSEYWEISRTSAGLNFGYNMNGRIQDVLFMGNDGGIGIGKTAPSATLDVNGSFKANSAKINGLLCAKEVRVALSGSPCWPDYVFGKEYKLTPLNELEQFITENQHLPNVPSAAEVETNGVELGEMNALLLQKVEELTLYILDLQKQINELKKQ